MKRAVGMIQQTLWDLLAPARPPEIKVSRARPKRKSAPVRAHEQVVRPAKPAPGSMAERYEQVTKRMLAEYGVRVRKWRTSMSGVAWQVTYQDGTVSRLIEAPRPRGPMSAAVFLHEIGHHAIGFGTYKPRCLEEYHAWKWSLERMEAEGLNVTEAVHARMRESLEYAVAKARRRGLKQVPNELVAYLADDGRRGAAPKPTAVG